MKDLTLKTLHHLLTLANLPLMDEIPNSEAESAVKLEMTVYILFHFVGFISSFEYLKLTPLLLFTTDCS